EKSALNHAERAELLEAICKSLGVMKTNHRNVLVLRCFELLSYAEIASVIGGSELHARVLFFHAKHALRRHLHNRGYGRHYFLTGLALFGLVTGIHTRSVSAAITVTSNLVKTGAVAATFAAITAKLGLMRVAAVTIGLVVGTLCVCSSDADLAIEFAMSAVTGADESASAIAHGIGAVEIADYPLPDPCDSELQEPEDMPPSELDGRPRSDVSAGTDQLEANVDCLAEANEIKTERGSEDSGRTILN
ncbi:MAG: RNA polymerase sigma factor, partial [Planctomycetota bacterium]